MRERAWRLSLPSVRGGSAFYFVRKGLKKMKKVKAVSAVLCTAIFASLLALSGCGGDKPEINVASSQVVRGQPDTSSLPTSEPSQVTSNPILEEPTNVTPGVVPESAKVDSSHFDDAVFIGDSVSNKLKLYTTKQRQTDASFLGKAQFLTAGSLGTHNALWDVGRSDAVHPQYEGNKMLLEDSVVAMKAKKVYIMLGMNDVALYGVDDSITSMQTVVSNILAKSPDAKIYIQSATPILTGFEGKKLNNATLTEYNQKLIELCKDKGYYYVDVASVMKTEDGTLIPSYCSDDDLNDKQSQGIHFTDEGCKTWVDYLYTHTA